MGGTATPQVVIFLSWHCADTGVLDTALVEVHWGGGGGGGEG